MSFLLVKRRCPQIRAMLDAYGWRVRRIDLGQEKVTESIEQVPCLTVQVLDAGLHACIPLEDSGRSLESVDYPHVLLALFDEPVAEQTLKAIGITRLKIRYFIAHRKAMPDDPCEEVDADIGSEVAWIRIHNDDFSPMQLVTNILQEVFSKTSTQAKELMMAVHHGENVSLGPFSLQEARRRAEDGIRMARSAEAPLLLSISPSPVQPVSSSVSISHDSDNPYAPPRSFLDA